MGGGSVEPKRGNEEGETKGGEREGSVNIPKMVPEMTMRGEESLEGESVEIGGDLRENNELSIVEYLKKT